ncbi:unnamed protein product [Callosobruchus maculatus]|uniref:Uncharacterized protein n=1 Tax=Callosobruchus maculatus TaxID=64391 RepID=A0A653BS40_CALMS|nr:unnamed protein product [Callosobruchus maculatus]
MLASVPFLVCFAFVLVECHPTIYKYNENKVLEPDLVPVSSTVIPLPVYKVSYGFNTAKDTKIHTKKKPIPSAKPKLSENMKHVSKKELREE